MEFREWTALRAGFVCAFVHSQRQSRNKHADSSTSMLGSPVWRGQGWGARESHPLLPNSTPACTQGQLQTPHSLGFWVSLLSLLRPTPDPSQNQDKSGVAALQKRNVLRLPFPSPGDLPNLGIESRSPALQADSLPSNPPGKSMFFNSNG